MPLSGGIVSPLIIVSGGNGDKNFKNIDKSFVKNRKLTETKLLHEIVSCLLDIFLQATESFIH